MKFLTRVSIVHANAADAEDLRQVAKSAFAYDDNYKPQGTAPGGPPGYASLENHRHWIETWDYFKCCLGRRIIGGCIVKPRGGAMELFGLFLHSDYIGQGFGRRLLMVVMARYPSDASWFLETPDYAKGNHLFYERLGFRLQHKSSVDASLGFGFYTYVR